MSGAAGAGEPRGAFEAFYLAYLSLWARFVVRRRKPIVVGITGSVGKTTTREFVAAVLREAPEAVGPVGATPRNMNHDWGVPLTLLGYRHWIPRWNSELLRALTVPLKALKLATVGPYPRVLVLEFAVGRGTEIERTVALAPPEIGVVTAIGPAHLNAYGTVERIAEVKGAVVRAVPASGLVVLGADSPLAAGMDRDTEAEVVKVPGKGRALSAGIARVVAARLGVPAARVERALARGVTVRSRQEEFPFRGGTVMNDAFNANPMSMAHGLETLAERARPGQRRVAILGWMGALGDAAERYHREMAPVAHASADVVVGVGEMARLYDPDHWFETSEACADALPDLLDDGDYVFVKGSNSVNLYVVVQALRNDLQPASASTPG
ncbi:MAG: Mur ligase family protein [Bacteroidota bacterium]